MTDRKLLNRYVFGRSQAAFAGLVERHAGMVYSTCLRMLGNREKAEEAAQAVFLILAREARELVGGGTLAGWLYTAAYNVACQVRRAEARRRGRRVARDLVGEKALVETSQYAAVD